MISKNQEKYIRSLQLTKYRKLHGFFVAETPKVVLDLLQSRFKTGQVFATEAFLQKNGRSIPENCKVYPVSEKELQKISHLKVPQEVVALVQIPEQKDIDPLHNEELTLVLDDIRDPGNMGTILRTAGWFGVRNVVCSVNSVDVYNPKVVQATMGSLARVNISYVPLKEFLKTVPAATPVFGCVLKGKNIYESELSPKGYIVVGNEAHGISPELLPYLTCSISIPSPAGIEKGVESLNAAIATAVVLSEFRRLFPASG
ncbi:MAG: RNA methyltransferase [Bacteroidales bacterium]|nr:RNA methyltransferase [Bacteroidales bacterium]